MTRTSRSLRLDRTRRKFLGVCAGLANYLEVEPWTLRLVYIGCCIFGGWFLVPAYFVVWFLLDEASGGVRAALSDNLAVKHFRTVDYRKKIYRNQREAKWLGICAGLADYLEVNAFAVRVMFLLLFFSTGGFALLFYLAAWMVLDEAPALPPPAAAAGSNSGQAESGAAAAGVTEDFHSGRRELDYCARKLGVLQERLARMEAYVTSKRFRLHREFRNMS
jgi:phage shock protein C